jgi:hypothetical protein
VTIQPGGKVEVTSDQLPEGQQAEVIVLLDTSMPPNESGGPNATGAISRPIWKVAQELAGSIPAAELANLPADLAAEHDHYIYGLPKRHS